MMFGISAEQEELRASVRRFLADRAPLPRVRELMGTGTGLDAGVWAQAANQLGLQGIAIPEEHGGSGYGRAVALQDRIFIPARSGSMSASAALRSGRIPGSGERLR